MKGLGGTQSHTNSPTHTQKAAVLIVAIELTKLKVKRKLAHEQERVWEEANYVYGAFLRLAFFRLKARGERLIDSCMVFGGWRGEEGRGPMALNKHTATPLSHLPT